MNCIPVRRAVELGARRIFVMHVGRVDRPLEPPRWPWEVALVAFEIARRHRFVGDLASLPGDVEVHVMPTGQQRPAALQRPLAVPLPRRVARPRAHRARPRGLACATSTSHGLGALLMPVPPTLVRRLVLAPARSSRSTSCSSSPRRCSLLLAALALAALRRPAARCGWRWIALAFAARHFAATIACLGLWLRQRLRAHGRIPSAMQRAHYAVLRWFVGGVYRASLRVARVEVRVDESDARRGGRCRRRGRPVVVLSRHAGEGDSLLVLHHLLCRHGRRPRVVMHEALRLDPLIDVLGRRLPNRFVDPRGGDTEVEIAAMTRGPRRRAARS